MLTPEDLLDTEGQLNTIESEIHATREAVAQAIDGARRLNDATRQGNAKLKALNDAAVQVRAKLAAHRNEVNAAAHAEATAKAKAEAEARAAEEAARPKEPTNAELMAQIEELKAKLASNG